MKTKRSHPQRDEKQNAMKRVVEISRLYERVRDVLDIALTQFGTPDAMTPKAVMSKLAELQSIHLAILKAEDVFHEKCNSDIAAEEIDFDAVRDDIGRQLDRIRATLGAAEVPKKS